MCKDCSKYTKTGAGFCLQCGAPLSNTKSKEASEKKEEKFFKHASLDFDLSPLDIEKSNKVDNSK